MSLSASLPRATDPDRFEVDPLAFLAAARRAHGDLFVIREDGPIFSRASDCAGVVVVFGVENQRAVLCDIESFGMPASAARHLGLPPNLTNLNRGLHSMRAEEHAVQKRLLIGMLNDIGTEVHHNLVRGALEDFFGGWRPDTTVGLLGQMRELTLRASARVFFGERHAETSRLALLLQTYFHLRRDVASPLASADSPSRDEVLATGQALDDELRMFVRESRRSTSASSGGILGRLATLEAQAGSSLSEDEVVGHSNVFFMSGTEPIAVSLTWILLVLSQLPALRDALRQEMSTVSGAGTFPSAVDLGRLSRLDNVIHEVLRLLPPNAFMVRITTRPTSLNGVLLPERCEVVLCPFVAHRDEARFERPDDFLPQRWTQARPTPFEYFPFGAGGHSCVGLNLAMYLMKATLAFLLPRCNLILAGDQDIDWRLHIMFMPRSDPAVTIQPVGGVWSRQPGKMRGPVGALLRFDRVL